MSVNRDPNYIAFDIVRYSKNYEKMFSDISSILRILSANGYACVFRYEDAGIYILEFNHNDKSMGTSLPYWITPEDYDNLIVHEESLDISDN